MNNGLPFPLQPIPILYTKCNKISIRTHSFSFWIRTRNGRIHKWQRSNFVPRRTIYTYLLGIPSFVLISRLFYNSILHKYIYLQSIVCKNPYNWYPVSKSIYTLHFLPRKIINGVVERRRMVAVVSGLEQWHSKKFKFFFQEFLKFCFKTKTAV